MKCCLLSFHRLPQIFVVTVDLLENEKNVKGTNLVLEAGELIAGLGGGKRDLHRAVCLVMAVGGRH